MTLASSSYDSVGSLIDQPGLLNLAWTMDEQALLTADIRTCVRTALGYELSSGESCIDQYWVKDPYAENYLKPTVAEFFSLAHSTFDITCGAGVNALLYAIGALCRDRRLYVSGDVYPDLAHWARLFGSTPRRLSDVIDRSPVNYRRNDLNEAFILLERPASRGLYTALDDLRDLCNRVAPAGAIVVVDESYANYFAPAFSAVHLLGETSNLVVLRGLSKGYWLGSLRFGMALTASQLTRRIRTVVPSMQLSPLSACMGKAVLACGDVMRKLRHRIAEVKMHALDALPADLQQCLWPCDPALPYWLFESPESTLQRFRNLGIVGKLQPFFSESSLTVRYLCRLSVPLQGDRYTQFCRKLAGSESGRQYP